MDHFASPACLLAEFDEIGFKVRDALIEAARRIPGETPRLEAEVLLSSILGQPRTWLLAHPEAPLALEATRQFDSGVARLAAGEPLAYVTGRREFFGLEFRVNRHVLVPRPDTELLVEAALTACRAPGARSHVAGLRPSGLAEKHLGVCIADIGTGSGCIAVALAVNLPGASCIATDVSAEALAVARANAEHHGVLEQIEFRQGDLLEPLAEPVDLLCANLPYVDSAELAALAVSRHEPRLALDGGSGGWGPIARLLQAAPGRVNPGGQVLLEIGATQGEAAATLARAAFPEAAVQVHRDLASLPRLLAISLPN